MHLAIPPMRQCCPHRTFVSLAVGFSQSQAWTKCTQETGQKRALPGLLWIDLSLLAKLFGSLTAVRVVLHGLRSSRLVDHRLGGETTGGRGICHLLGEYTVARPVRLQSRPVSGQSQQRFVLDDGLVDQELHSTFEIVLRLENGFGRIVCLERTVHWPIEIAAVTC